MSDIDIPLPIRVASDPEYRKAWIDAAERAWRATMDGTAGTTYADDPATWIYEHKDGWQFLAHFYNDGTSDLSMRPNSSAIWSPPLEGEKR